MSGLAPGIANVDPMTPDTRVTRSPSSLKTPGDLSNQIDALFRARQLMESQWKLNLAFYRGKQYAYYNKASRRIEQLPVDDGDKPRFRVRLVSNQILNGTQALLAKLTKNRPNMHATPGTGSTRDLKAAQMAERLLEFWWQDFQLDDSIEEAGLWALVAGQGFWEITWDPQAGKQMQYLLDPQGQPVVDQTLADLYRANLSAKGIQPQERTVYLGDIRVQVVSPFDLYWDPTVKKWTDCKWVYRVAYLDPDTIKGRWKVDLSANAVNASPDATLPVANAQPAMEYNVRKVVTGYFVPQPGLPKGRIVTWSPGHGTFLEDKPWDLPTHDLPYVKFSGVRVPGEVYDQSVIEHAVPLQKELNRSLSQIVEFKNLSIKPQWMAPVGSLRQRMTNEPGAVFEYVPVGGQTPQQVKLESIPAYVFQHVQDMKLRIDDVFALTPVAQGSVPPNVEAGVAIDLLQEMSSDRITPQLRLWELGIARAGRLMLTLAKQYYVEPRLLKIRGFGGTQQVKEFTKADIEGAVDVVCEAGSGLPRTRAGKQARVEWMMAQGLIQPQDAFKYIDTADLTGVSAIMQLDEDEALREQDSMLSDQPFNKVALEEAQEAVQQGVDPKTGQQLQAPEQGQEALERAAFAPTYFQNHQVHMDIHTRFVKSAEYEALDPHMQERFQNHIADHFEIFLSFPTPVAPVAPRVTWNIRSSVGPTVGAEILRKSGVNAQRDELMEPPMPWATESVSDLEGKYGITDPNATQPAAELAIQQQQQAQQQQQQQAEAHQQGQAQQAQAHQMQMMQRAQQLQHAQQQHEARQGQAAEQFRQMQDRRAALKQQLRQRAAQNQRGR